MFGTGVFGNLYVLWFTLLQQLCRRDMFGTGVPGNPYVLCFTLLQQLCGKGYVWHGGIWQPICALLYITPTVVQKGYVWHVGIWQPICAYMCLQVIAVMHRMSPMINKCHQFTHQGIFFMTESLDVTPRTTEQNLIVHSGKSEAAVTNNTRLRSRYCIVEANC